MTGLLDGKIAAAIAKGFNGKLLTGTLRKLTSTGRDGNGDAVETPTDYVAQGYPDTYTAVTRAAAGIPALDVRIVLIAGLCGAEPAIGDRVQFRGQWHQVRHIDVDPARATFDLQCFKVGA